MTARIDLSEGTGAVSVRVAGRLDEAATRDLLDLCRRQTGRITLDLEDLQSADRAGVGTLKGLRDAGARIEGATPYVRMLLNGGTEAAPPAAHSKEEDE